MIKIKRVYQKPEKNDEFRILVDRLWPHGLNKKKAKIDLWMKEIAPSTELRKWFSHKLERWQKFRKKNLRELRQKKDLINKIKKIEKEKRTTTLLFSAKDEEHNNAIVLKEFLNEN